jgi:fructose-specific component phosphotransferase system IIB-like protein
MTAMDGKVLFSGDLGTGAAQTTQISTAVAGMTIVLGNPAGADVYLNGKKIPTNQTHAITIYCTRVTCA